MGESFISHIETYIQNDSKIGIIICKVKISVTRTLLNTRDLN